MSRQPSGSLRSTLDPGLNAQVTQPTNLPTTCSLPAPSNLQVWQRFMASRQLDISVCGEAASNLAVYRFALHRPLG